MQKTFNKVIAGLLPEKETALLAISGGIDSICMGALFLAAGRKFSIAHCNFHLRGAESDYDEQLVRKWADSHGIKIHVAEFDTLQYASEHSVSIEMAARELRYDWFAGLCIENDYYAVSVAHNANDNAETLMLNLLRGTGLKGLSGMKDVSEVPVTRDELKDVRLIRPLLSFTRNEIVEFVSSEELEYHDDHTNAETIYKRNRIRHKVFPVFESLNPSFLQTFGREMRIFSQENAIADEYFESVKSRVNVEPVSGECLRVDLDRLSHEKHIEYILYRLLEQYGFKGKLLDPIIRLVTEDGCTMSGKTFESPGYKIRTASGRLSVVPAMDIVENIGCITVDRNFSYEFDGVKLDISIEKVQGNPIKTAIRLASLGVIAADASTLTYPFVIRRWRSGDWMRPIGVHGRKKLSDMFVDLKVGTDDKLRAIVVISPTMNSMTSKNKETAGDHVAAVCGYASGRFYCRVDEFVALSSTSVSMLNIRYLSD